MLIKPSIRDLFIVRAQNVVKSAHLMAGDHHCHRAGRRGASSRKWQSKIYNFLERPTGSLALAYHILVFLMVFFCLGLSVFQTIPEYEEESGEILYYLEVLIVIWFSAELLVRAWSAGCRSRYQGWVGRAKFFKSPFCTLGKN